MMLFFLFPLLSAPLFLLGRTAGVSGLSTLLQREEDSQTRMLTAITLQSELERRDVDFTLKHHCEHHYADHVSLLRGESARFAKTSMSFKLPALALEDIESHLESIKCSNSVIVLEFEDGQALAQSRRFWDDLSEFLVVSSHPGCNGDGERALYIVSDVAYSAGGRNIAFSVHPIEWKEAYSSIKMDFGMTGRSPSGQYSISGLRFHENVSRRLRRRQVPTSSTIAYPSVPTSTPSSESSVQNLTFQNNKPAIVSAAGITVGCMNCTFTGIVDITQGTFTVNNSAINNVEEVIHFIENGFFDVVTNGVSAHIELDTSISAIASLPFTQDIFTLALPGFQQREMQIPRIAVVGPLFNAALVGTIGISNAVNFTYGFDLVAREKILSNLFPKNAAALTHGQVPDGSSINLDVGNLTNSSSLGFSKSKITALPFAASSEDIAIIFTLGLQTEVAIAVSLLSGAGNIRAGAFLDLPAISVAISPLSGVNADCEPLNASTSTSGFLSHIFSNLTNIKPSAVVGIGLEAGATLVIPDVTSIVMEASTTLAGTQYALETVCLSWDSQATVFVRPTFSDTATTTAAATATGSGSQSGSGGQKGGFGTRLQDRNPFSQTAGLVWATGILLGCTMLILTPL